MTRGTGRREEQRFACWRSQWAFRLIGTNFRFQRSASLPDNNRLLSGFDTATWQQTFPDMAIIAVGVGSAVEERFLRDISGDIMMPRGLQVPGKHYFTVPDFQSLNALATNISSQVCQIPESTFAQFVLHQS